MKTTGQLYKQFLVSSQVNYTCTHLAENVEGLDENSIHRFLKNNKFEPNLVWEKIKSTLEKDEEGYLLFDDSVLDKDFSFNIEGVRKQYSGNEHGIIKGIGVVNCVYYNPKNKKYKIIDFRIFDPDRDGRTKIDHVLDMLKTAGKRQIPFKKVLMDSWYATVKIMKWLIDKEKIFYCPLKENRLVDFNRQGYCNIKDIEWNNQEQNEGKLVKVRGFPMDTKLKLFRVFVSTNKTEFVVTNDITQNSSDDCQKEIAIRWKIEQFHREIKQLTGIEKCQCRKNRSQRNHICLCMQVWIFLSQVADKMKTTIYQVKSRLLRNYMVQELRNPSLVYC